MDASASSFFFLAASICCAASACALMARLSASAARAIAARADACCAAACAFAASRDCSASSSLFSVAESWFRKRCTTSAYWCFSCAKWIREVDVSLLLLLLLLLWVIVLVALFSVLELLSPPPSSSSSSVLSSVVEADDATVVAPSHIPSLLSSRRSARVSSACFSTVLRSSCVAAEAAFVASCALVRHSSHILHVAAVQAVLCLSQALRAAFPFPLTTMTCLLVA